MSRAWNTIKLLRGWEIYALAQNGLPDTKIQKKIGKEKIHTMPFMKWQILYIHLYVNT